MYLYVLVVLILWIRKHVFLTFHIKFECLFIFNQLQQLLKCACAEITKTNTELRNKMLKNRESLLLGTRHFLIYDKWPPSLSFDRVKTFYGDPLKTFFSLSYIYTLLQININSDLNTIFCWYLKKWYMPRIWCHWFTAGSTLVWESIEEIKKKIVPLQVIFNEIPSKNQLEL